MELLGPHEVANLWNEHIQNYLSLQFWQPVVSKPRYWLIGFCIYLLIFAGDARLCKWLVILVLVLESEDWRWHFSGFFRVRRLAALYGPWSTSNIPTLISSPFYRYIFRRIFKWFFLDSGSAFPGFYQELLQQLHSHNIPQSNSVRHRATNIAVRISD